MSFMDTHGAILVIAVPLLATFLMPLLGKVSQKAPRFLATIALFASSAITVKLALQVWDSGPIIYTLGSSTDTIFRIQLIVDGMGVFMALIMAIVSLAVSIYSWSHMKRYTGQDKYYALLLLVAVGSYGMVLTGDIFNLFVFFEISSISLCGLVAFRTQRGESFEAAFKYMLYSTISGVLILFAIGIFYGQYGILNMTGISHAMAVNGSTMMDKIALGLLATVFALKAGSVPMHMTTPDAYGESPAAITALFVAASQAGLYALFRTGFTIYSPAMDMTALGWVLIVLGILSMFVGVTMALVQSDIKRLMAYHAISQTGYMLLGVGVGMAVMGDPVLMAQYGVDAMRGGIFHIINHAMYKGLLFLTAGAIIHRMGTSDLNKMHGLGRNMKWTAIMFILGALAIAGLPPTNGFSSKFMIYESVFHFNPILAIIAMLVSILTLASFVKVFYSAFLGPRPSKPIKEAPTSMLAGMGILAAVIVVLSLFPGLIIEKLVDPAVAALIPGVEMSPVSSGLFPSTLLTGDGFWSVLVFAGAFVAIMCIAAAVRSMGSNGFHKRDGMGQPYYFGNKVTESARVSGGNVYWGFLKAMDGYYRPVKAEHTGDANDYVSWLLVAMAIILAVVVFL